MIDLRATEARLDQMESTIIRLAISRRRLALDMEAALEAVGQVWPKAERHGDQHDSWGSVGAGPRWLERLHNKYGLDRAEVEGLYLYSHDRLPENDTEWARGRWELEVLPGLVRRYRGREAA